MIEMSRPTFGQLFSVTKQGLLSSLRNGVEKIYSTLKTTTKCGRAVSNGS